MDIPGRQVLDCTLTLILVFDPCRLIGAWRQGGLESATGLDARLLIGTQDVLVCPEWLALPAAGVQVEHRASDFQEVRIAWEDPALVAPGTQRILQQPAPDAAARR